MLKRKRKGERQGDNIGIVLTGGHAGTSALATLEELKRRHRWRLYWIGAKKSMEGRHGSTLEAKVFPKVGVGFYTVPAARYARGLAVKSLLSYVKIPLGVIKSVYLLLKIRPALVLSFGGYVSIPVVIAAFALRIPIVVHEQILTGGLANRITARFARRIAISRLPSKRFFDAKKVVYTGNPTIREITAIKPKTKISPPPHIFVTGGSRGSETINRTVGAILPKLRNFVVIHQTGELDYEKYKIKEGKRYRVHSLVDPREIHKIYQRADIVISRAGANTVAEVIMTKRPSILIPIPWSIFNEQMENAKMARKSGVAVILAEKDLTPEELYRRILEVKKNWKFMVESVDTSAVDIDRRAAENLAVVLEDVINA